DVLGGQVRSATEQSLAQGFTRFVPLTQAATLAQLWHDELHEIARGPERVVLAQVDPVDTVLVEPAFDFVCDDTGGSRHEVAAFPPVPCVVDEVPRCLSRWKRSRERHPGLPFALEDVGDECLAGICGRVD